MRKDWKSLTLVSYLQQLGFYYFFFFFKFGVFVLVLLVSQTEPHGMLCAPVQTSYGLMPLLCWGPQGGLYLAPPPRHPIFSVNYSQDGKTDGGCKLLLVALLLKRKHLFCCFCLFFNEVPYVSS